MKTVRLPLPLPYSRAAYLTIIASTGLAILLLAASVWLAHVTLRKVEAGDVTSDQVHSAELATETLFSTLKDAETGQRGYLLTGDVSYLAPYDAARLRLDRDFIQLESAPLMNPERGRLIEHLRSLAALKLEGLGTTVALYQSGQFAAALDMVRANHGKRTMDAIRSDVDALQASADAQLRNLPIRNEDNLLWGVVIGLGILASALLGGVALAQRRARIQIANSLYRLERFTRAFGLTQGMIREMDGRISFWSVGAERLYGYRSDRALGRKSQDLLRTGFPQPLPEIQAALLDDGHWQGELVHFREDGSQIFVASYWALHRGEAGESDVIIEINNDITGRKRAESELRDSELKLRLALGASGQGVWRWELAGGTNELIWDSRCRSLFGFADDALIDREGWAATFPADERAPAEDAMRRALDPADPHDDYSCEHRVLHQDGQVLWVAEVGRALFEPDRSTSSGRRVKAILGTVRDISNRKRSDIERQRTGELLRTIIETAPALIYAKDLRGRMLLANAPVLELIGKPWDQVQGRSDLEFLDDPKQGDAVMRNDRRIMAEGQTEKVEELVNGSDGQSRTWISTKAPMHGADGAVIGLVGISVDITEQKRARDRLRLMVNELNHRVKNTLATVQAITSQTLRGLDPVLRRSLDSRLLALASAHDVLTRESWERGTLQDVVTEALIAFDGWDAARFWISGPPVSLRPTAVLAIAMGLHELATNALKFGALSDASGRVEIRWETTGGEEPLLRFFWTERNGPNVSPPDRQGFGLRLLERTLAQDLRGTTMISFDDPRGVVCRIEAPLAEVIATAETVSFPRVGCL
jgi:PAS domain S-box-containing protein